MLVGCDAREAREPDENAFALAHGQSREVVGTALGQEVAFNRGSRIFEHRLEGLLEEVEDFANRKTIDVADRCDNQAFGSLTCAHSRTLAGFTRESRLRSRRPK